MFRRLFYPTAFLTVCVMAIMTWTSVHYVDTLWKESANRKLSEAMSFALSSEMDQSPKGFLRLRNLFQAEVLVYDRNGHLVFSTLGHQAPVDSIREIPGAILEKVLSGQAVITSSFPGGNSPVRQIFSLMGEDEGRTHIISLMIFEDIWRAVTHRLMWATGITAASGLIFLWVAMYYIARWVTDPIERIAGAFSSFSRGMQDVVLPEEGVPEIAVLARRFNEMTRDIRDYQKKAQESERLATAGVIAAGLAHEIRNPLTSLTMAGQILMDSLQGRPEEMKRVETIVRETKRLDRIVNEFLGRVKEDLRLAPSDIGELVRRVVEGARVEITVKGIDCRLELGQDLPELQLDAEKVEQILWNLLRNAAEAMGEGGVITVRTCSKAEDPDIVCVQVDDEGPGLDDEVLRDMFRPFFTTKGAGLGLGLSISRQIARRHGGDLMLFNREEGGVRAELCLPCQRH